VLGGLTVPLSHSADFEAEIIGARDQTIPIAKPDGTPRVIKWEKANAYNLASYKKVADAFFGFEIKHKVPIRLPNSGSKKSYFTSTRIDASRLIRSMRRGKS
jgi:hypothetical protein